MDPKEIVRIGYNDAGSRYTTNRNENLPEMKSLREFAKQIPKGGKILDLGCGGGVPFTKYLSKRFQVTGIDISEKQIELARNNVPNASFVCGDMTTYHFPESTYQGILAYYSIIHIPRNEHRPLFSKIHRLLAPNGVILFSLHSTDDPASIFDDFFGTTMYWSGYDKEKNLEILKEVGFQIIWSKLVEDSLGDSKHLFVFAKKP